MLIFLALAGILLIHCFNRLLWFFRFSLINITLSIEVYLVCNLNQVSFNFICLFMKYLAFHLVREFSHVRFNFIFERVDNLNINISKCGNFDLFFYSLSIISPIVYFSQQGRTSLLLSFFHSSWTIRAFIIKFL